MVTAAELCLLGKKELGSHWCSYYLRLFDKSVYAYDSITHLEGY